jgi:hypothetical protein
VKEEERSVRSSVLKRLRRDEDQGVDEIINANTSGNQQHYANDFLSLDEQVSHPVKFG